MFRGYQDNLDSPYTYFYQKGGCMKEKAKLVYSTDKSNKFPILGKRQISKFREQEIGEMSFIAKRSKSIKQPYSKHLKRHGRTITMKPEDFNSEKFKFFREIYINPGTTQELAERVGKKLGVSQFHLKILEREFPNILSVSKIGTQNYYRLQKEESTSAEALYTKYRKPFKKSSRPTKLESKYEVPKVETKPKGEEVSVSPTIQQLSNLIDKFKSLEHMVIDVNLTFNIKFGG